MFIQTVMGGDAASYPAHNHHVLLTCTKFTRGQSFFAAERREDRPLATALTNYFTLDVPPEEVGLALSRTTPKSRADCSALWHRQRAGETAPALVAEPA